jgi:cation-transporting ATPase 13A3/4/5
MFALIALTLLNLLVLLYPPQLFRIVLELLVLPFSGRTILLFAVVVNIAISMAFERWGVQFTAKIIGSFLRIYRDRRRIRKGKVYKLVEGGAGR